MHLRVTGKDVPQSVFEAIGETTNGAILYFQEATYDKAKKVVRLPITRFRLVPRRKWFGLKIVYQRDKNEKIRSLVTIRDVASCEVTDNSEANQSDIQIIFGLTVREDKIILASAEESTDYKTAYAMELKVDQLDIEISDDPED